MADANTRLDEEILAVRKQSRLPSSKNMVSMFTDVQTVHELTSRRRTLSSSILASTKLQNALARRSKNGVIPEEDLPIVSSSKAHAESNVHRLAFSTTAFPFTDPSPTDPAKLLGVRIDVCRRSGRFEKPYYLLLKKGDDGKFLHIYRHTIPVCIPLRELERRYLPQVKEDSLVKQNLHMLVRKLRLELVSWVARRDAVDILQEELGLLSTVESDDSSLTGGIKAVAATSAEARYIRLEWHDGRVGRVKLTNKGFVERAVVYGPEGRDMKTERLVADGQHTLYDVADGRHTIRKLAEFLKSA